MNQLAPQSTPLATEVINDPTMPAGLFQSYARLFAAAAAHGFQHTQPLDFDSQVVPLLGLRRSQVRQHLQALRFAKLLDWSTDGANRYVFRFKSGIPDSVVGVVDSEESLSEDLHQQQQESEKADSPVDETADKVEQQARNWLLRAGVWSDAAARLARQVAENEQRLQQGETRRLPGRADVLGWMAYCFAGREKNGIALPAAVLAANLGADRPCPPEYLPPAVCSGCGCTADYCECPDEPELVFPPQLLELALALPGGALSLRSRYSLTPHDRWGVCLSCHALPCKCP